MPSSCICESECECDWSSNRPVLHARLSFYWKRNSYQRRLHELCCLYSTHYQQCTLQGRQISHLPLNPHLSRNTSDERTVQCDDIDPTLNVPKELADPKDGRLHLGDDNNIWGNSNPSESTLLQNSSLSSSFSRRVTGEGFARNRTGPKQHPNQSKATGLT